MNFSTMILSSMELKILTCGRVSFRIMTLTRFVLGVMILNMMTLSIMAHSIMILTKPTLSWALRH
jgi:hypothetical protein